MVTAEYVGIVLTKKCIYLEPEKGSIPVWEELDPFEDLEERKVKKQKKSK